MSLVPEIHKTTTEKTFEITQTYIQIGRGAARSTWVKINPKNPVLKVLIALPIAAIVLTVLILFLIILGFTLLALILAGAFSRGRKKNAGESQ